MFTLYLPGISAADLTPTTLAPLQCKDAHIKADWYWALTFPQAKQGWFFVFTWPRLHPDTAGISSSNPASASAGWTNSLYQCSLVGSRPLGKLVELLLGGWMSSDGRRCITISAYGYRTKGCSEVLQYICNSVEFFCLNLAAHIWANLYF